MPISLPLDIIDLILSYLRGTASIADCALVCQSWLPSARYHLLPDKALRFDNHIKTKRFFSLLYSPESTLSLLPLRKLTLVNEFDSICEESIVADLLTSDFISFPSVTSLYLGNVKWRTLSPLAVASLHSNLTSVKELELARASWTFSDFCSLIFALETLEELRFGYGFTLDAYPSSIDTVRTSHPSLRHIYNFLVNPSAIRILAKCISYASGITTLSSTIHYEIEQLKPFGELLETAGTSLRALKLEVYYAFTSTSDTDDVFSELLTLRHNPNLEEIDIRRALKFTLPPLFQGLKTNTKPNLCRLRLQLEPYEDVFNWTEGPLVEEALSAMFPENPKLTINLTILPIREEGPRKIYLEKSLEKLKELLRRTAQHWTLKIGFPSPPMYLQSTPSEIELSITNCSCNQFVYEDD